MKRLAKALHTFAIGNSIGLFLVQPLVAADGGRYDSCTAVCTPAVGCTTVAAPIEPQTKAADAALPEPESKPIVVADPPPPPAAPTPLPAAPRLELKPSTASPASR